MGTTMEYNYDIDLTLVNGTESLNLTDVIKMVMISYDYDTKNMPSIYIGLNLTPDQYNTVVKNKDSGQMMLNMYRYDSTSQSQLKKKYINNNFTYMMTSDPDYNQSLNSGSTSRFSPSKSAEKEEAEATSYFNGYIALIKEESMDNNNKISNDIIRNTNLLSIIHKYTQHMQMVIEPLDSDHDIMIDQLIIAPVNTITELLSYIDNLYDFYSSGYRYFRDFDKTYLLSNSGNPVPLHDGTFNKVLINICDPLEIKTHKDAMEIDQSNNAYVINVDANSTSLKVNQSTGKTYNSAIKVDSDGNTTKTSYDFVTHSDSTEKVQIRRTSSVSSSTSSSDSYDLNESTGIMLSITKAGLDSSILTPNKEYLVSNYKDNKDYNGRYVLSYKKEALIKDGSFVISTTFGLRKVSDS